MTPETAETLVRWAETYNDRKYFEDDPIIFPTRFLDLRNRGIARADQYRRHFSR